MKTTTPPCIAVVAPSGTGKTTLLTQVIRKLTKEHRLKVAAIKKTHHDIEVDQPGKDSFKLREAGATSVILASPYRQVVIHETRTIGSEPKLKEQLELLQGDYDIILAEGFREEAVSKIELYRSECSDTPLLLEDPGLIALACDAPEKFQQHSFAVLDINSPHQVTNFILEYIAKCLTY